MKKHRSLSPYNYILTHHLKDSPRAKQQTMEIIQPLDQRLVLGFVTEVLRMVVPLGLLGCKHNARACKRFCRKWMSSGKCQDFRLGSLISHLKITNVNWLDSITESTLKMNIFAKVYAIYHIVKSSGNIEIPNLHWDTKDHCHMRS
jgi:hypothetical protein